MVYLLIFVFGLIMGSFLLVLGDRGSKNESVIKPKSHCDNCQKELKWYHLIPLFSYIFLKGKCSYCHKKISILCPIIELLTAILFLIAYLVFGKSFELLTSLVIISVMITILVSDFKYLIILNSPIVVGSILLLLINYFQYGFNNILIVLLEAIIMFLIVLLIKLIGDKIFKRESLGGGDVKLAFFIGCALGLKFGLISFAVSSFLAIPYSCFYLYKNKNKEIPFGPFLIISCLLVFIFQNQINNLLDILFLIK